MPLLSFDVYSNYEEVARLRAEITMLENRLKSFGPGASVSSIRAVEAQLQSARAKFRGLTMDAAQAGASLELNIRKGANGAIAALNDLQAKLTDPIQGLTQIAGVAGLGMFLNNVAKIRGQFQLMESNINTLLGSAEKGQAMMAELTEYAKVSPLDFQGTVGAAQMMLGFGIDQQKILPFMKALGDVSMGDAQRFQSLTLAFSQMSAAGKLMGQDLMQMVNAGFQPLEQMAKDTGKSIGQLKEEMSQGKISAEMVQEAFINATSEGGKYFNMSQTATATISGQMSMLGDATDLMFNDLGKKSEDAIIKVIQGATWLIENYEKVGGVLGTAIATFGIYKASAMASEFAIKVAAEEKSKAIVQGFEEEIAKMEEYQRQRALMEFDDDVRGALETGAISTEMAEKIQMMREEIEVRKEAAEAAVQSAQDEVLAANDALKAAQERLSSAQELVDAAEQIGDADDQAAAAEELLGARMEFNAAATNLLDAETNLNTANRELNTAATQANAVAQIQQTNATNANTTAQTTNTAATGRGAIMTALSTAKDKAATIAKWAFTAATNACTKAWNSLKVAFMTNPIGLIITALTTVIGLFMTFKNSTEEASAEVERFGENAVKTKRNLETMVAVLHSVDKTSKVFKDTLKDVIQLYKDYGIEGVKTLDEVIAKQDTLNKLIEEEGRQRQLANLVESFQKENKETSDKFIEDMAKRIKSDSSGEAKDNAERFAQIMASTIEAKRETLNEDYKKWQEAIVKYNEYVMEHGNDSTANQIYNDEVVAMRNKMLAEANSEASEFAKNLGLSNEYVINDEKGFKLLAQYLCDSNENARQLNAYLETVKASREAIDALRPKPAFDPSSFADANELAKEFINNLNKIDKEKKTPQVNKEQIEAASSQLQEAVDRAKALDASDTNPNVDKSQIDSAISAANEAVSACQNLDNIDAEPKIRDKWITNLTNKINSAWIALQKLLGNENPEPLIKATQGSTTNKNGTGEKAKTPGQQAAADNKSILDNMATRINNAKSTNDFDSIRKSLQTMQKSVAQDSEEYKRIEKLLKNVDKKDKSKKDKSKDDPKQRAYELRRAQIEEEKRTAELLQAEKNRQRELEIAQMEDNSAKEIATIKFNAEKKRQALLKEAEKEAQTLEKNALQEWLKGGKSRKEYQYYAQFSEGQLAQMREQYMDQAKVNVGYDTQNSLIANSEAADLQAIYRADAEAMRNYLKEYGTFQQKRLAIAEEYAEKIRNAQNAGERLQLTAQRNNELGGLEAKAMTSQIDWYSVFDNVGVVLRGQLEPLYKQLQEYVKSEAFRKSGADNQQTVISAMENIRGQLGANESWRDLSSALADYQTAINELRVATENDAAVNAELARLTAARDAAGNSLSAARQDPNATAEQLKQLSDGVEAAQAQLDEYAATVSASNQAMQEAQNRVQSSGTMLSMTAKNVMKPISKIYTFLNGAGLSQLAELWGAFDQLKGGIDGLKALNEAEKAAEELADAAKDAGDAVAETAVELPVVLKVIKEQMPELFDQLSQVGTGINQQVQEGATGVQKGMQDAGKMLAKVLPDELLEGLGKAGLIGQIISAVLKILDVLKDGVGTLISSIIDSFYSAISGIIDNILSGEMFKQIGESLYKGLLGVFKSIFTFGGLFDWWGNGESDKNLEKDVERLTATNDALRRAVDNLADVMRDAAVADAGDVYKEQKSNIEQAMKNTQEMMARSGAAYSNGFLGVGGHRSSNTKINKGMDTGDWSRISKIVGGTIANASDFWNLTSEQMAKVAQDAPDLYAKIKALADDGYKDAGQYMDDYIEYYKELEELENAYREKLTDVSLDSVKDEFKSMLLDMESSAEDFADNFEKLMQQAVVNSLMSAKYDKMIKEWYNSFAAMMEDGELSEAEQRKSKQEWDNIVADAVNERDRLKKAMGWDGSSGQQSSSRTLAGMSQDTGNAIEGRLTALQIAVESIRAGHSQQSLSLAEMNDELLKMAMEYSRFNVHQDNIERQLAKIYIELQTISENTGAIVKPIQTMQADIAEIKKNTNNL